MNQIANKHLPESVEQLDSKPSGTALELVVCTDSATDSIILVAESSASSSSTESQRSTFPQSEQQKIRELVEGLENAQAATDATIQECRKLFKQNASTVPSVRQSWEILPQQKWEQLNQEELLCWVQVLTESRRQNCSPLEIIETWKTLCNFDTHAHLKVNAELMNSDTKALTNVELLELASAVLNRAFEMEVNG